MTKGKVVLLRALTATLLFTLPALADPAPGERLYVDPDALPPPHATPSASNPPEVVARKGAAPVVPAGYRAELVAEHLDNPRNLVVAADGTVIVAEAGPGRIVALKDGARRVLAEGFDHPHGLALADGGVLVGDVEAIWHLVPDGSRRRLTPRGALGSGGGHWTRSVAVAADGLFVGIGSEHNVAEEPLPRASIQHFNADGSGQRTFASGLRNPVGLTVRPGSDELWAVVNERDGLGDGLVPDYLTRVRDGGFYGWPYSYIGDHAQPGFTGRVRPALVPDVLFQSHSAPLGLAFWHGDAFVSLHGSWNAAVPVPPMVVRVPFKDGRPAGGYEVFAAGFTRPGPGHRVWGRPVGLAVGPDDALYLADDAGATVWRIRRE